MSDDAQLQAEAAQLEQLLAELRELIALPVWRRVEDALRRVVRLYGAGLARALAHARESGASGGTFDARIAGDELLASLLVLHGLHPLSTEQRVRRALAAIYGELGIAESALALVEIRDDVVVLAATRALGNGAMSPSLAESIVRRALLTAAPEVARVEIRGLPPPRGPTLVQLRTRQAP